MKEPSKHDIDCRFSPVAFSLSIIILKIAVVFIFLPDIYTYIKKIFLTSLVSIYL